MKKRVICLLLFICSSLAGCWDKTELTDRAFVMGAAIDQMDEKGKLLLTVQFIKPSQPQSEQGGDTSYLTVSETDDNFFAASRNITEQIGRHPNWSHMQLLLIGEEAAKSINLIQLLDFFIRHPEPRATTHMAIVEGKASDYLAASPAFELTGGRQLRMNIFQTSTYSSKTVHKRMFDFYVESESQGENAILPYLTFRGEQKKTVEADGVAVMKQGKMIDHLSSDETQMLLLITEEFDQGVIAVESFPKSETGLKEVVEVLMYDSNLSVTPDETGKIEVKVDIYLHLSLSEMVKSRITSLKDMEAYGDHIASTVETRIRELIDHTKEKGIDPLQVENQLYRHHHRWWKQLKDDWDEHYRRATFVVNVGVEIDSSNLIGTEPIEAE